MSQLIDQSLRIEVAHSLEALKPLAAQVRELNRAARRPSPFHTVEYIEVFLAHDEFAMPSAKPLVLLAFDGDRLAGFLALRRRPDRVFGLTRFKLELLVPHDSERPTLVARPEDEARCAMAFYKYLAFREPGWSALELIEQDNASALKACSWWLAEHGFVVRQFPTNPNATIRLNGGFERWFADLGPLHSKLSRLVRPLTKGGALEFWSCVDRAAAVPLLGLYVDLEGRSWKRQARAGISRHPRRIELFKQMVTFDQEVTPLFQFVVVDGLPLAAALCLLFEGVCYQMEVVFDEAARSLSPGNVLLALSVRDVAARGCTAYDMLGNFAYHKARFGAAITETHSVQVFRRHSVHALRSFAGALKRRLVGTALQQAQADHNLSKPKTEAKVIADAQQRREAKERTRACLQTLNHQGVRIDRLDEDAIAAALKPPAAVPDERTQTA